MRTALLCILALAAPAATVATLDGRTLSGPTLRFEGETVRIGSERLALADCDWLEPGSGSGVNLGKAGLGVWLVDGGWLPATALAAGPTDHALRVISPLGTVVVPLTALRGWSATGELPGDEQGDRVLLDSGPVAGRIEGIVGGKLQLRSELSPDKPLEFALDQVRGLRLAVAVTPSAGPVLAVSLDADRPALLLKPGDPPALAAVPGATLPALTDGILVAARLRVDAGRRRYLSDLTPATVEDVGAFGVVWPWQRDASLDGSPLRLGGARFAKGIVVHSRARLLWKLDGGYLRLRALAGIADLVTGEGDCAVTISGDGKPLWTRPSVKGRDKPVVIDVDLSGVQQLELVVDLGARHDIGDHFALADAYLVRR